MRILLILHNLLINFRYLAKHKLIGEFGELYHNFDNLNVSPNVNEIGLSRYFIADVDEDMRLAINYLQNTHNYCLVPYRQIAQMDSFEYGIDDCYSLPYVMHGYKRLFFPHSWTLNHARWFYRNYIESENLLGSHYKERTPHQYLNDSFQVSKDDIFVDIGSAESLMALEMVDKVKYVCLIENDPLWAKPIECTFADYQDKVIYIKKTIGDHNDDVTVTLETVLENLPSQNLFIKMDIEGAELSVLRTSYDYLKHTTKTLRFACCVYHRETDAKDIADLFDGLGYHYCFSDGYIFTSFLSADGIPTLRKGVIRVWK